MPNVIGIRFRRCGKIYDFEIDALEVNPGSQVVVESSFGLSIGTVVSGMRFVEETDKELKKVLRVTTEKDFKTKADNEELEREAKQFCHERIVARVLPMKLVHTEVTLDRKRVVFYFTADGRIDFRDLVKDLASRFKTRIEMRQIGVRDETKFIGGMGVCGREVCCRSFLSTFAPVSIRMAKRQDLVLNPGKLSGLCGRLMCCLGYEVDEGLTEDVVELTEDSPILNTDEEFISIEKLSAAFLSARGCTASDVQCFNVAGSGIAGPESVVAEESRRSSYKSSIDSTPPYEPATADRPHEPATHESAVVQGKQQEKQGEGKKPTHRKKRFHKRPPQEKKVEDGRPKKTHPAPQASTPEGAKPGAKPSGAQQSGAQQAGTQPSGTQPAAVSQDGTPQDAAKKKWRYKKHRGKKKPSP
ncbi:MAG: stage 0 sporulation protein [Nitrospirae bacterium]|nr:stage 0 sporulation protein [Nitrospirota bacterium]